MTEKIALPKLMEFAMRLADDICDGQLLIVKAEDGWRAWFGAKVKEYTDTIAKSPTIEDAVYQALSWQLKITIKNLSVMQDMLEDPFPLDDDLGECIAPITYLDDDTA